MPKSLGVRLHTVPCIQARLALVTDLGIEILSCRNYALSPLQVVSTLGVLFFLAVHDYGVGLYPSVWQTAERGNTAIHAGFELFW